MLMSVMMMMMVVNIRNCDDYDFFILVYCGGLIVLNWDNRRFGLVSGGSCGVSICSKVAGAMYVFECL